MRIIGPIFFWGGKKKNVTRPKKKIKKNKKSGPMIRIGGESQCLPYAGFFRRLLVVTVHQHLNLIIPIGKYYLKCKTDLNLT